MTQLTKAHNIHYLDLLPFFRNDEKPSKLYIENDDHLSEYGHSKVLALVVENIIKPFMNEDSLLFKLRYKEKAHKEFSNMAIDHQVNVIRNTPDWFENIKKAAEVENLNLDTAIYDNAKYVISKD